MGAHLPCQSPLGHFHCKTIYPVHALIAGSRGACTGSVSDHRLVLHFPCAKGLNCPHCGPPAVRVGLIDGYKFYCYRCGWNHEVVLADLLLPFNPGSDLAHLNNPELVLVGGGPWRILRNLHARCCTGLVRGVLSTTSLIAPHCSAQEHAA